MFHLCNNDYNVLSTIHHNLSNTNMIYFFSESLANDDSNIPLTNTGLTNSNQNNQLYQSHSNPDLMSCYDDLRGSDYPEHVLKVFKSDQTCKYLLVS